MNNSFSSCNRCTIFPSACVCHTLVVHNFRGFSRHFPGKCAKCCSEAASALRPWGVLCVLANPWTKQKRKQSHTHLAQSSRASILTLWIFGQKPVWNRKNKQTQQKFIYYQRELRSTGFHCGDFYSYWRWKYLGNAVWLCAIKRTWFRQLFIEPFRLRVNKVSCYLDIPCSRRADGF